MVHEELLYRNHKDMVHGGLHSTMCLHRTVDFVVKASENCCLSLIFV